MAALLNWQQMRPHAKSQNPLQLCSAHGDFPVDWADLMCRTRKPAAIRAQLHPRAMARSRVQGHSIKGCLPLHLKRQLQLIRLHLNRSTGHQRAGLAMLSKALEDLEAVRQSFRDAMSRWPVLDDILRYYLVCLASVQQHGHEHVLNFMMLIKYLTLSFQCPFPGYSC